MLHGNQYQKNHHRFYERLILILKLALRKKRNAGSPELKFEKLYTVLTQCKNIMNTTIVTKTHQSLSLSFNIWAKYKYKKYS